MLSERSSAGPKPISSSESTPITTCRGQEVCARRRYYGSHGQECAGPAAIVHGPAADPPAWNFSRRQFHGFLIDCATHLDSRSLQAFGDQSAAGTAERPKQELER